MARGLSLRQIDVEHYFIEPDIKTADGSVHKALKGLIEWFDATHKGSGSLGVVRADGGTGKTTLSRRLAAEVRKLRPNIVPLLIEADQWRHQLQAEFRIPNVWDIALARCLSAPSGLLSNETAFRVLVREGLIWVIFDGFDELCLHPQFSTSPPDVIQSFIDDLATQDEERSSARILLTSRDSYWRSYEQQMPDEGLDEFLLLGFSNDQKKQYFTKRLEDSAKVHNALRYCSEIGGRLYEGVPHEEQNKERMEGTPFVLDLVAEAFEGPEGADINPYVTDPLEDVLLRVCRRENVRQRLDIRPERQLALFEELFREKPGRISESDLRLYIEIICETNDVGIQERFRSHFLLRRSPESPNDFLPRYEVLRTYLIARFLAKEIVDLRNQRGWRQNAAFALAQSGGSRAQVVDWLAGQLRRQPSEVVTEGLRHAFAMIRDPSGLGSRNKAGCALFAVASRLLGQSDKCARAKALREIMSSGESKDAIDNGFFSGVVKGFDFTGLTLQECFLEDVEFRNCNFDTSTRFVGCDIVGSLAFSKCRDEGTIQLEQCRMSMSAEYSISKLRGLKVPDAIAIELAREVVERALRKFRGPFGFHTIFYSTRARGLPRNNPLRLAVWDVLLGHKIIQSERIAGERHGGLIVAEDPLIRKEIQGLFDNANLGRRLDQVVNELAKEA